MGESKDNIVSHQDATILGVLNNMVVVIEVTFPQNWVQLVYHEVSLSGVGVMYIIGELFG